VGDGAEKAGFPLEGVQLLRGGNQGEYQFLERDHSGRSFGAVGAAVRRLRQHRQDLERSRARGGAAFAATISVQRSGA